MEFLDFDVGAKAFLAFLLALMLAGAAYALLTYTLTIPNTGNVITVGVEAYWDSNATVPVEQIDWGNCTPGANYTRIIYILNSGNKPCNLTFQTENWNPANASNYINVIWNYTGQILQPNEIIPVELELSVSDQISGIEQFSFDLKITAVEVSS